MSNYKKHIAAFKQRLLKKQRRLSKLQSTNQSPNFNHLFYGLDSDLHGDDHKSEDALDHEHDTSPGRFYFKMLNDKGELYTFNNTDFKFEGKGHLLGHLNAILTFPMVGVNPFLMAKSLFEREYTVVYHDTIKRNGLVMDE